MSHERVVTVRRARVRGQDATFVGVALALAVAQWACGGEIPEAKAPQSHTGRTGTDAVVSSPKEQLAGGAPAGPAGGAELSGSAKDSYDQGFQAWASGDLKGARAAFSEAANKAPKATGPPSSLGGVFFPLPHPPSPPSPYPPPHTPTPTHSPP